MIYGPFPCPRFSIALIAPLMYAFAFFTDSSTGNPFARFAATALESVQPVPCVFGLSILSSGNQTAFSTFFFLQKTLIKQIVRIFFAVTALT